MQFIYRKIFSFRLPGYSLSWEHFTHMNLLCSCFCPAYYIVKFPWFQEDFTFFSRNFAEKMTHILLRSFWRKNGDKNKLSIQQFSHQRNAFSHRKSGCHRSDSKAFDSSKSEEGEQCCYRKAGYVKADFNSGIRHFRDIRYFTREQIRRDNRELATV